MSVKEKNAEKRIGEKHIANNGLEMKIITYRRCDDIDIEFSDGTIVEHTRYAAFRNGNIKNPNYLSARVYQAQQKHLGERRQCECGTWMELVAYRKDADVDIKFDDGTIVKHKAYGNFLRGYIRNPNQPAIEVYRGQDRAQRIGERRQSKLGLWMTLIEYRTGKDVDVQFDDGVIIQHKSYSAFVEGNVGHPVVTQGYKKIEESSAKYLNKTTRAANGLRMKIIAFRIHSDVDIQFEDGVIVAHRHSNTFTKGTVSHPNIGHFSNHSFYGVRTLDQAVLRDGDNVYYNCTFPDGTKDILTPQEIMERQGIHPVF